LAQCGCYGPGSLLQAGNGNVVVQKRRKEAERNTDDTTFTGRARVREVDIS
jgi:hypothetical protein